MLQVAFRRSTGCGLKESNATTTLHPVSALLAATLVRRMMAMLQSLGQRQSPGLAQQVDPLLVVAG